MKFSVTVSAVLFAILLSPALIWAAPTAPTYTVSFNDDITGDNQFTNGGNYWFINTGPPPADSYANDLYERPTAQTYTNVVIGAAVGTDAELNANIGATYPAASEYLAYVDIVSASAGVKGQYMYFGIELYGDDKILTNGNPAGDGFGSGTYYNVHISTDPDGTGGVVLWAKNAKDLPANYTLGEQFGDFDRDGTVGGPGGVTTPDEGLGANPGYEINVISDGQSATGGTTDMLWARRTTSLDGRPFVEFAFDYVAFNAHNFTGSPDPDDLLPDNLESLFFDAARGLQGPASYLWNDKYNLGEAGSPYEPATLGNIYEVDSLRVGGIIIIPEPASLLLIVGGLPLLLKRKR